jgi:FlaA1/EpsC-like NDP-sugar epimerase
LWISPGSIELSGLEVRHDIEIVFIGCDHEKLQELFIPGESYRRTEHQKIFMIEAPRAPYCLPS